MEHVIELPEEYLLMMVQQNESKERVVCDYIAGMSDSYAIDRFEPVSYTHLLAECGAGKNLGENVENGASGAGFAGPREAADSFSRLYQSGRIPGKI